MEQDQAFRKSTASREVGSVRRRRRAAWAAALLAAWLVPAAGAGEDEDVGKRPGPAESSACAAAVAVEKELRAILEAWARAEEATETAAARISDFQQQVLDGVAGFEVDGESLASSAPRKRVNLPFHKLPRGHRRSDEEPLRVPGSSCLREVGDNTAEQLAAVEPAALLPVAWLFHHVYVRQMAPPARYWLAGASLTRVVALAHRFVALAEPRHEARQDAARMLVVAAEHLHTLGNYDLIHQARGYLDDALKLAPESVAARYLAAYLAERQADYRVAADHLERLLTDLPGDPELRLRLALNQARTGHRRAAVEGLEGLARGETPDWMRSLAYQELAQLHARDGGRAAAYLREATSRLPGDPTLALELAYFVQDDWSEAAALVERVARSGETGAGLSPRLLYELGRDRELAAARKELVRAVELHRPALARAHTQLRREEVEKLTFLAGADCLVCEGALP